MDAQTVRRASRAGWGPLLEAGVQISEYQPTMYHCKVMVVDDLLVSVGSTNFDNRSFRLNDEANLNIYDEAFAKAQVAVFEEDLAREQDADLRAVAGPAMAREADGAPGRAAVATALSARRRQSPACCRSSSSPFPSSP